MAPSRTPKTNNRAGHTPTKDKSTDKRSESSQSYQPPLTMTQESRNRELRRGDTELWPICPACRRWISNEAKLKLHKECCGRQGQSDVQKTPAKDPQPSEPTCEASIPTQVFLPMTTQVRMSSRSLSRRPTESDFEVALHMLSDEHRGLSVNTTLLDQPEDSASEGSNKPKGLTRTLRELKTASEDTYTESDWDVLNKGKKVFWNDSKYWEELLSPKKVVVEAVTDPSDEEIDEYYLSD